MAASIPYRWDKNRSMRGISLRIASWTVFSMSFPGQSPAGDSRLDNPDHGIFGIPDTGFLASLPVLSGSRDFDLGNDFLKLDFPAQQKQKALQGQ